MGNWRVFWAALSFAIVGLVTMVESIYRMIVGDGDPSQCRRTTSSRSFWAALSFAIIGLAMMVESIYCMIVGDGDPPAFS